MFFTSKQYNPDLNFRIRYIIVPVAILCVWLAEVALSALSITIIVKYRLKKKAFTLVRVRQNVLTAKEPMFRIRSATFLNLCP